MGALTALAVLAAGAGDAATSDREADLERIRGEIARLQARLVRLQERTAGVAGELAQTELRVELQGRRVEETRAEKALAEERVAESERQVEELSRQLAEARAQLGARLATLHRMGRAGPLRLLASLRSEDHLLEGIRWLRYLAIREAGAVDRYRDTAIRVELERERLAAGRAEISALLRAEAERLDDLEKLRSRQGALLARLERESDSVSAETEVLVAKEQRLATLIDQLYGRDPQPLAGTPLQSFEGVLDWPLAGRVLVGFGPRLDPRYRTRVPHNGVQIEAEAGAPVRVVFPGKVLFAAPFEGFGLTVVVHHPSRVFTLYADLTELQVAVDDMLSLGTVVGLADERLYFEIRVDNRPVDPLEWLR